MLEPTTVFVADSFFAGTSFLFCYHRRLHLLPPATWFATTICSGRSTSMFFLLQQCHVFAATGSHRRYNWLTFLLQWCRRAFNLLEALPFFATTGRSFCCYRHPDGEYSFLTSSSPEVVQPAAAERRSCVRHHRSCDRRHREMQLRGHAAACMEPTRNT